MRFHVLTLFPELFQDFQRESIIGRAVREGRVQIALTNIRDFGIGRHKKVDDTPYGGSAGMVMACGPIFGALEALSFRASLRVEESLSLEVKSRARDSSTRPSTKTPQLGRNDTRRPNAKIRSIYLSPRGRRFTQRTAERLSKYSDIILLCGRYEGVDQRVIDFVIDEEISIGDYVLSGGELPAMVMMEAVIRLLPGVLGKEGSHEQDSFSKAFGGKREYPHYTKPAEFRGMKVPEVLLSGHHGEVEKWRKKHLK